MDTQIQFLAELNQLMDKLSFLSRDQLKVALRGYKAAEVHTIEFIGQHPDTNATTIADALYVTRGAVSKMTKRLIDRGLITRYQKPDNQKETYFQLTQQGQTIFATHERLTRQFMQRDMPVFDENPQEVAATLNFLHEYNQFLDQQVEQQK
ncbi:MarR family transcriptional regulator [Levilactobacillus brevis]|uniref:MarR family transcriptional regulator n=1 Tax=Levilactobacillus brevis TaxID=1580 RepID=UPI00207382C0|nr:MarR family transcriptional regulator [Levilactobacillus brevis]